MMYKRASRESPLSHQIQSECECVLSCFRHNFLPLSAVSVYWLLLCSIGCDRTLTHYISIIILCLSRLDLCFREERKISLNFINIYLKRVIVRHFIVSSQRVYRSRVSCLSGVYLCGFVRRTVKWIGKTRRHHHCVSLFSMCSCHFKQFKTFTWIRKCQQTPKISIILATNYTFLIRVKFRNHGAKPNTFASPLKTIVISSRLQIKLNK